MVTRNTAPLQHVVLAWTGASGLPYGLRLLECLLNFGVQVDVIFSEAAQVVAKQEMGLTLPGRPAEALACLQARYPQAQPGQLAVHGRQGWLAGFASGSNPAQAMVICPCSMGTLARVAHGLSHNLIDRSADVMLKERLPLILVPREMPFSEIHLENMLKLARMGAVIMPPSPGFYHQPQTIADLVDFVVARVLDHLGWRDHQLHPRWGENER